MVSLRAGSAELGNSASFVVQGADVLGSFQHDGETWRVDPLGGGLTAVYRYDTSNLLMDPPGWGMRQRLYAPEPTPMDDAGASVEGADTGDTIDLMVVYTPAAAAMGNIDLFIRSALDNTHDSYEKSNIGSGSGSCTRRAGGLHATPQRHGAGPPPALGPEPVREAGGE